MSDADNSDAEGAARNLQQDDPDRPGTWLDGLSPEEQLQALDKREAHIRGVWAKSPGWGKIAFGELEGAVGNIDVMRNRIKAGLHPIRDTPEEEAQLKKKLEASKREWDRELAELRARGTWFKGPNWRPKEDD
jgi:hypothetical protein